MIGSEISNERRVADSPEAQALTDAITTAMFAYRDFLDKHGLIWKNLDGPAEAAGENPCKVEKLIAEINFNYPDCGLVCDIQLIGGALNRAYGDQPLDEEGNPKPSH
jgi:hypothetical protein